MKDKITILFCEDDPLLQESIQTILELRFPGKLEFILKSDGSDGLQYCREADLAKLDLIISDNKMNGRFNNGLQFYRDLRKFNTSIPFILYTNEFKLASKATDLTDLCWICKLNGHEKLLDQLRFHFPTVLSTGE